MNLTLYILELLGLMGLFTLAVVPGLNRDPVSFVSSYPPDIRKEYYRSQGLPEPRSGITGKELLRKLLAGAAALALMALLAGWAGARSYWEFFGVIHSFLVLIAAFDTFFLDWVLFPRIRRWRVPGTENMDQAYAQKWFHLKGVLLAFPLFLAGALAAAVLGCLLF